MASTKPDDIKVPQSPDDYHHYTTDFTRPWHEILIRRLLEEYEPSGAGDLVIDVGTGTALLPIMLAEHDALDGVSILGLDYFDDMVERAREAVTGAGLTDRIEIRQADAHDTGLEDGCADAIVSRAAMHHVRDPAAVYREMWRLLKPGATAIVHDIRRDAPAEILEHFQGLRAKAGFIPTVLEEKYTVEETREQIEAARLSEVATVATAEEGRESLGYEVMIRRPAKAS